MRQTLYCRHLQTAFEYVRVLPRRSGDTLFFGVFAAEITETARREGEEREAL